jgi:hypothetical protein
MSPKSWVSYRGRRLQAKTSTEEMYASIDEVVDKLGAQLRKLKERKVNHKFGDSPPHTCRGAKGSEAGQQRAGSPFARNLSF